MATRVTRRSMLVVAGVGVPVLVAACGAPTAAPAPAEKPAEEPKAKEAEAMPEAKVSGAVHFLAHSFFRWHEDNEPPGQIIAAFREEFPDIELNLEPHTSNRREAFLTSVAAGQPIDITSLDDFEMVDLGLANLVSALNDNIRTSSIDPEDLYQSFMATMTWVDGRVFGLPYAPDMRTMYLHEPLYTAAGFDYTNGPQDWAELEEVIAKTTKQAADGSLQVAGYPPAFGSGGHWDWLVPYYQMGGETFNAERTKSTLNNELGIMAHEWVKKVYEMQGGWQTVRDFQSVVRPSGTTRTVAFAEGKLANIYMTYSERSQSLLDEAPELKFTVTEHPKPPNAVSSASLSGDHVHFVAADSEAPDAAWTLLEFITRPENVLAFCQRFDRVPVLKSVAESEAFTKNDPHLLHQSSQIPYRVPFGEAIPAGYEAFRLLIKHLPDMMTGAVTIQEGLKTTDAEIDQIVTKRRQELGA